MTVSWRGALVEMTMRDGPRRNDCRKGRGVDGVHDQGAAPRSMTSTVHKPPCGVRFAIGRGRLQTGIYGNLRHYLFWGWADGAGYCD